MKKQLNFAVQRGDRRQKLLCDLLCADGHCAQLLPEPEKWDKENLPPPGSFFVIAKADEKTKAAVEEKGFLLLEYGNIPSFKAENGEITAENALAVAMKHRLRTIRGADCLVIGWGNIGKPLASRLKSLKANTVGLAVRREEQLWSAKKDGIEPFLSTKLEKNIGEFDVVFNTAPTLVLPRNVLMQLRPGTLVIDLASKPGGVDLQTAKELEIKVVQALGLPGIMTPVSAAAAIQHAIYELCKEEQR